MSTPKLFAPAPSVASIARECLDDYPEDLASSLGEVVIFTWFQDHSKTIKGRDVAAYVRKHTPFERALLAGLIETGELSHAVFMSEERTFKDVLYGLTADQGTLDLPLPDRPQYRGMIQCVGLFVDENVWTGLNDYQRRALIDHELRHISVTHSESEGIVPKLVGHDLEEFVGTVRRYGLWHEGVKTFVQSAGSGGHRRAGGE